MRIISQIMPNCNAPPADMTQRRQLKARMRVKGTIDGIDFRSSFNASRRWRIVCGC